MRYERFLILTAVSLFVIVLTFAPRAYAIDPIGPTKPPVQTDPCIFADMILYADNRVTTSVGGDSNAKIFLDSWTLTLNESRWGNLYQREENFQARDENFQGVAITRDTILSTDGSLTTQGTTVFTDPSTFEGGRGSFTSVTVNGNLADLKGTYIWNYDFWNFQHTGELRLCIFLK